MSTTTVTATLLDSALFPLAGHVVIEIGGDTGSGWVPIMATRLDGTELLGPGIVEIGPAGALSRDLTPNDEILPAYTIYRITLPGDVKRFFSVPVSSIPVDLDDLFAEAGELVPDAIPGIMAAIGAETAARVAGDSVLQAQVTHALPTAYSLSGVSNWNQAHGYPFLPAVRIVDSSGETVLIEANYPDSTHVHIQFPTPFTGTVYLGG